MSQNSKQPVSPTIIDRVRQSSATIPLDATDPLLNPAAMFRDPHDNPQRAPGPINIQKTAGGMAFQGIPTFFRAPVALGPEDLVAGRVDVAIMGASVDQSIGLRGTAWAPQAIRTAETLIPWGELMTVGHATVGDVDFMQVLKVCRLRRRTDRPHVGGTQHPACASHGDGNCTERCHPGDHRWRPFADVS